jgi:CRISPR-associated exonuclease Cas4
LIPLSALQHISFCERQCALIHVEQVWVENRFTAEGHIMHAHVDAGKGAKRGVVKIEQSVPLRSFRLGLVGKADVVEFHRQDREGDKHFWMPFPVEYKRGRPKKGNYDKIQLCAQALCLEEMLACEISKGALFYGKTRRRQDVKFNAKLRGETEDAAVRLHGLIESRQTPPPEFTPKCRSCSFVDFCLPDKLEEPKSVQDYLENVQG